MPRRNSPNDIRDLGDLSRLGEFVVDKRLGQRAAAKKNRRNRHCEKQFIRHTQAHRSPGTDADLDAAIDSRTDAPIDAADTLPAAAPP